MQTAHHSDTISDFLDSFRGRLHAPLQYPGPGDGKQLARHLFPVAGLCPAGPGGPFSPHNLRLTGENPLLGPNASLHIGLAIHELAANAMLHGGLAEGCSGSVTVDAHVDTADGGEPELVIQWQETGIDRSRIRRRPRFGTLVLERIVPVSVGGAADYAIDDDTVSYRLVVGADQFEA